MNMRGAEIVLPHEVSIVITTFSYAIMLCTVLSGICYFVKNQMIRQWTVNLDYLIVITFFCISVFCTVYYSLDSVVTWINT
jgi:hypothetical protein